MFKWFIETKLSIFWIYLYYLLISDTNSFIPLSLWKDPTIYKIKHLFIFHLSASRNSWQLQYFTKISVSGNQDIPPVFLVLTPFKQTKAETTKHLHKTSRSGSFLSTFLCLSFEVTSANLSSSYWPEQKMMGHVYNCWEISICILLIKNTHMS